MHEYENWHWENDIPVHGDEGRRTCSRGNLWSPSAKPGM